MTISIFYDERAARARKRSARAWTVTVLRDGISDTERFDTEAQAREYAAKQGKA